MKSLDLLIAEHPFFDGLNIHYLPWLEQCATYMRFGIGQPIFQQGSEADHFYLIEKGQVGLETFVSGRGDVTIQTLGPGEALGWSWLMPPYQWHFTARSLEPSEMIAFCAKSLRDKAKANPEFGYELVIRVAQVLFHRLEATRRRLLDVYEVNA
jgi:CRP-like cAMP-binding protein